MANHQLWLLVGGNGAGKSTFYKQFLEPRGMPFVNADLIAKALYADAPEDKSYQAARDAEALRNDLVDRRVSFCFETVFSHVSKIDFVARAKAAGYQVILVFIHLAQSELNVARVYQRVQEGGHRVPTDKIHGRIPRLLENVRTVIPLCDHVRILDNSSAINPFQQILTIRDGIMTQHQAQLPEWAQAIVEDL